MDPNACLRRFLDACEDEDRFEAQQALADLKTWIDKNGALPDVKSDSDAPSEQGFSKPYYSPQRHRT